MSFVHDGSFPLSLQERNLFISTDLEIPDGDERCFTDPSASVVPPLEPLQIVRGLAEMAVLLSQQDREVPLEPKNFLNATNVFHSAALRLIDTGQISL
jgi:hypothetical protein